MDPTDSICVPTPLRILTSLVILWSNVMQHIFPYAGCKRHAQSNPATAPLYIFTLASQPWKPQNINSLVKRNSCYLSSANICDNTNILLRIIIKFNTVQCHTILFPLAIHTTTWNIQSWKHCTQTILHLQKKTYSGKEPLIVTWATGVNDDIPNPSS
jgi:hypothetical protein